jgi:hypothetical protein
MAGRNQTSYTLHHHAFGTVGSIWSYFSGLSLLLFLFTNQQMNTNRWI